MSKPGKRYVVVSLCLLVSFQIIFVLSLFRPELRALELDEMQVRVRLRSVASDLHLSGFQIHMPYDKGRLSKRNFEKRNLRVRSVHQGGQRVWKIKDSFFENEQTLALQHLDVSGDMLRLGLDPVPDQLRLFVGKGHRINVVAALDIESYLAGVLPSEMPASWPLEALKAQAVASRSYMYAIIQEREKEPYHLDASILDQVYNHSNRVHVSSAIKRLVDEVIRSTRGEVLSLSPGRWFKAFYHADCGGETEEPLYVWGIKLQNGTVKDASCPSSPQAKWDYVASLDTVADKIAKTFELEEGVGLESLKVASRTPSGRVQTLRAVFQSGIARNIGAQEFRKLIGFNEIKSTNFNLVLGEGQMRIVGKGHGHGVGLCQWGARAMAREGANYREILKRYYPQTQLMAVREKKTFVKY